MTSPSAVAAAESPCWAAWPLADALRLRVVVLGANDGTGTGDLVALTEAEPNDLLRRAVSARVGGRRLGWRRVSAEAIDRWLGVGESAYVALSGELATSPAGSADAGEAAYELSIQSIESQANPVMRLLDATLFDALKSQSSDVHLESDAAGMRIRQRLDGVMRDVGRVASREWAEQLVSRLKVMAELDIGETRLPQDGRFKLRLSGRDIDFRLSVMPTAFGEDAVVRVLDGRTLATSRPQEGLESLGFPAEDCKAIRSLARRPYGLLVVTGPTGSGKTTTLYALIGEINEGLDKIVTIEDPIEYQLPGVVQIPVNEKKGLTFARGLRSVLRHDPDRVMVGEIRDPETAQIATQAALTGHMVLTTIHASNALDVVGRFMHMGLDLYNLVSALHGVVAQRLLRRVCAKCAAPAALSDDERCEFRLAADEDGLWLRAVGCEHCFGTGYRGRRAVAEVLMIDDVLRDLIASRAPLRAIKEHVRSEGATSLRAAALGAARQGHTTLEEVRRVTIDD